MFRSRFWHGLVGVALVAISLTLGVAQVAAASDPTTAPSAKASVTGVGAATAAGPALDLANDTRYIDALNRGDVAGVMALWTDDGVLDQPGPCPPAGCVGKPAIERVVQGAVNTHSRLTILSIQASGDTVTTRYEARSGTLPPGVERTIGVATTVYRGDLVALITVRNDLSDPQTAGASADGLAQLPPDQLLSVVTGFSPGGPGATYILPALGPRLSPSQVQALVAIAGQRGVPLPPGLMLPGGLPRAGDGSLGYVSPEPDGE